jgi:hypothetical protein
MSGSGRHRRQPLFKSSGTSVFLGRICSLDVRADRRFAPLTSAWIMQIVPQRISKMDNQSAKVWADTCARTARSTVHGRMGTPMAITSETDATTTRLCSSVAQIKATLMATGIRIPYVPIAAAGGHGSRRIDSLMSWKVNIGTPNPSATLQVAGSIAVAGGYFQAGCPSGTTLRATNLCMDDSDRASTTFEEGQATCRSIGAHMCTYSEVYSAWPHGAVVGNFLGNRVADDVVLYISGNTNRANFENDANKAGPRSYRCCFGPFTP